MIRLRKKQINWVSYHPINQPSKKTRSQQCTVTIQLQQLTSIHHHKSKPPLLNLSECSASLPPSQSHWCPKLVHSFNDSWPWPPGLLCHSQCVHVDFVKETFVHGPAAAGAQRPNMQRSNICPACRERALIKLWTRPAGVGGGRSGAVGSEGWGGKESVRVCCRLCPNNGVITDGSPQQLTCK